MRKLILFLAFGSFALLLSCAKSSTQATSSSLNATDSAFAVQAMQTSISAIQTGQLTASNAGNDLVKSFGSMALSENNKAKISLDSIALSLGFNISNVADSAHQLLIKQLSGLTGFNFDLAYAVSQVNEYKILLDIMGSEIKIGKSAEFMAYANRYYPVIQTYLSKADSLVSGLQK